MAKHEWGKKKTSFMHLDNSNCNQSRPEAIIDPPTLHSNHTENLTKQMYLQKKKQCKIIILVETSIQTGYAFYI